MTSTDPHAPAPVAIVKPSAQTEDLKETLQETLRPEILLDALTVSDHIFGPELPYTWPEAPLLPANPPPPKSMAELSPTKASSRRPGWYVVTRGVIPGIYTSWLTVSGLVLGRSGAVYKKFNLESEAREQWAAAWAGGDIYTIRAC